MAKNIDFMGAVFPDVPSIRLPQQGGGFVSFDDTTDANATASDIAEGKTAYVNGVKLTGTASGGSANIQALSVTQNGTYTASGGVDGYSPVTVSVSGGGGGSVSPKQINFIDYDGTILHSYTKAQIQAMTSESDLPSNPSHTGLTAQGWNWTLAQIKAQLIAAPDGDVWVGQMYVTDDGKTRIYIHLIDGRLHPYLGICPNGTVVVDWGDNSATSTITGTSLTTTKYADHTYASEGDYVITLTVSSGKFAFYGKSNTSLILTKTTDSDANIHQVYTNAIKKVELGTSVQVRNYAFCRCHSLETVTMPSALTDFYPYVFYYCYSLKSITLPSNITSTGSSAFYYCYALENISMASATTTIGQYAFQGCSALTSVTIPSGVSTLSNNAFSGCASLASVYIPNGTTSAGRVAFSGCLSLAKVTVSDSVTSIGGSCFSGCYGVGEYHIKPTTVPTLGSSAFNNIPSDCVIYVPSAKLNDYKTAQSWSSYASYMQGE